MPDKTARYYALPNILDRVTILRVKRMAQILFGVLVALCLGLVLLLGTSGFWLPWTAPRLLGVAGVEVDAAERGESGELILRGVRYGNPEVEFSLSEFRAPMPLALLWNGWQRTPEGAGKIRLRGLEVQLREAASEPGNAEPAPSHEAVFDEVDRWLALADRWLPPVFVENLVLTLPGSFSPWEVPLASFRSRILEVESLRVSLPGGSSAKAEGKADLKKQTFSLVLQADLQAKDLDAWAGERTGLVGSLHLDAEASGSWSNPQHQGSIHISLEPVLLAKAEVSASWQPESGVPPVTARGRGRLGETGVHLEEIQATYGGTPLLGGQLVLPVTLHPWIFAPIDSEPSPNAGDGTAGNTEPGKKEADKGSFWRVVANGALSGFLSGKWSPALRDQIQKWGGPSVETVDLELKVKGTVQEPEARLSLRVQSMILEEEWVGENFPQVRNLELTAVLDAEKILLEKGFLELRDSGIRVTGELPYAEVLRQYREKSQFDLSKVLNVLKAEAELSHWNAAVWKDRLPTLMRPQGRITGAIGIDPGLVLRGKVEASQFSLRPTLYSSAVDDMHATLRFEGRQVHMEDAGASVGGGTLSASGTITLEDWLDPRYEFKVTGMNVPVVRTTDMILRSDADLTFALDPGEETPLLQGDLTLRNSTYLIDFDPFAPNVETGPGNRPPYFSVEEQPFADWRCDLTINGRDFLRVRSSLFATELSAALRLTRTLGDPLLLGSVRATSGRLRFPGMNMRIESLEAFITPEDPNLLQIEADAIGQNRRYVVTMNVSGSSDSPQIQFSSTPNLSNAQIVRLLATGTLDGGGAGAIGLYLGQALMGPGTGEDTLADRLSVEIGQEVTENGRSTVDVTYRLSDRWSVEGEYDRYDTYNLNLIRILFER